MNGNLPADRHIAILLPFAENFSARNAGAVALDARSTTRLSRFRDRIRIFGKQVEESFPDIAYQGLEPVGRWFRGRNRGLAEAFWRHVRANPPALTEVHNRPQVFNHLAKRFKTLPLTLHFHNDPQTMKACRTPAERRATLDRAAAIYCVSHYVRGRFLDGVDGDAAKVHVLYSGIERPWSVPPEKEKIILFVGRLIPDKGAMEFVEAVAPVLVRHPGWRAVMAGAKKPGRAGRFTGYEKAVYDRITRIGPAAEFLGYRPYDAVMELFGRAAIAVVPSLWAEPFGRTAAEALACGCSLVSSDRGGLAEIGAGRGLLVADPSSPSLGEAIERLVSDDALRADLQERAWRDFPFDIRALTARQDDLRAGLLTRQSASAAGRWPRIRRTVNRGPNCQGQEL